MRGKRIVIVGDVLHSRVARCDMWGLTTLGAEVVVCAPPTLLPPAWARARRLRLPPVDGRVQPGPRARRRRRGDGAAPAARAQQGGLLPGLREYSRLYGERGAAALRAARARW